MADRPRIGMIGDGNVGTALTQGLAKAGYEVQAVGKEPGRVAEIARWAEAVVLAVPFGERANALREMGDAVDGKVVVDVTNALTPSQDFAVDLRRSGAEELQGMARGARVVKAFNTVFAPHMSTGRLHGEPLTVFAAGDDPKAKRLVLDMARAIGFDAVDAGPLQNARWLEALGFFNVTLGYKLDLGPAIGLRLVRADAEGAGRPQAAEGAKRKA